MLLFSHHGYVCTLFFSKSLIMTPANCTIKAATNKDVAVELTL
jgi:hypothetical protein